MPEPDQRGLEHEGADEVERAPERAPVERVGEDPRVVLEARPPEERQPDAEELDGRARSPGAG